MAYSPDRNRPSDNTITLNYERAVERYISTNGASEKDYSLAREKFYRLFDSRYHYIDDIDTLKIILPRTIWQADLVVMLSQCKPKSFTYILTHVQDFRSSNKGLKFFDHETPFYSVRDVLLPNLISALKYGIEIYDVNLEQIIISIVDSTSSGINPEIFNYLVKALQQAKGSDPDYNSLISKLISLYDIELLDILLSRLTKEQIEYYINDKDEMAFNDSILISERILETNNTDIIIELLSLLNYYGINMIDAVELRQLIDRIDGDQGKGKYRAFIAGEYPPYIPPSVKQKVLITTELIRQTPGNYMHLLPNELAMEIYSHLY